jgi:hypothetical protein
MKTNVFQESILQPGDDILAHFADTFGTYEDSDFVARNIECDPTFAWSCTVEDEDLNEVQVHDFESESELRDFLTGQGVEID